MINSVKSIIIAASALAMSVFAAMPSSAQEKVVRYEGSVSVGAGYNIGKWAESCIPRTVSVSIGKGCVSCIWD